MCVCPPSCLYHVSTSRRISLGGEGNALYPVLSSIIVSAAAVAVAVVVSISEK